MIAAPSHQCGDLGSLRDEPLSFRTLHHPPFPHITLVALLLSSICQTQEVTLITKLGGRQWHCGLLLAGICAHGIPSGQQIPFLSYVWRFSGAPNVFQHASLVYPVVRPNVQLSDAHAIKKWPLLRLRGPWVEIISALFLTFTLAHGHAGLLPPPQQTLWRADLTP